MIVIFPNIRFCFTTGLFIQFMKLI